MKVALYDVDSVIPNLALMKISTHHKERGDEIIQFDPLFTSTYDKIYASKIFKYSDGSMLDPSIMEIGGTGWDLKTSLPPEIEALPPDYALYNYPHSLGFTIRGCRFRCKFCVVPEKEGEPYFSQTIDEIWRQRGSDFVVLLDNDFFGNPEWADRVEEIRTHDLRVNFSQGLNIRLITEEQAAALASVKFRSPSGKFPQVHFAWDQFGKGTEKLIDRGIQRCLDVGLRPYQMAFYVLIGFNTTPEQDHYRVTKLRDLGCDPYAMTFNKHDPYQRDFSRWVNQKAIFNSVPWSEYVVSKKKSEPDPDQMKFL